MNDINHIRFSARILTSCGLDSTAAFLSNAPGYIGRGKFYNNMFNHALTHLPDMVEVVSDVLSVYKKQSEDREKTRVFLASSMSSLEGEIQNAKNYSQRYYYKKRLLFYRQILSSLSEIGRQFKNFSKETELPLPRFYKDQQIALFLAFLSYIYFDLWVNPRQLFFPATSVCSGSWDLWEEIDYFRLAETFSGYDEENIFFPLEEQGALWGEQLNPYSMVKYMIVRMGEKGSPSVPYSAVDWNIRVFLRYLGAEEYKRGDAEFSFIKKLEAHLDNLFREAYVKV
tara:strand:+ start:5760 stop:6611 length:852 start_codon:yes stop_codon:yes gene_type:complete